MRRSAWPVRTLLVVVALAAAAQAFQVRHGVPGPAVPAVASQQDKLQRLSDAWDAAERSGIGECWSRDVDRQLRRVDVPVQLQSSALAPSSAPRTVQQPSAGSNGGDFHWEAFQDTGWSPPDPTLAVGPESMLGMVNGQITLFRRPTQYGFARDSLESFFAAPGGGFDPRGVYDPHTGRFLAIVLDGRTAGASKLHVAASHDAFPRDLTTGTGLDHSWYLYDIDADAGASLWADYPGLGFSNSHVYITANMYDDSATAQFVYSKVWAIDKTSLYAGDTLSFSTVSDLRDPSVPAVASFSVMPARHLDTSAGSNVQHFISMSEAAVFSGTGMGSTSLLVLWTFTGTALTGSVAMETDFLYDVSYSDAQQAGSSKTVCTGDSRFQDAFFDDSLLWTAHTVQAYPSSFSMVRWYAIDPSLAANDMVTESGVVSVPDHWLWQPSIAVTSAGNRAIVYAISGADRFPGIAHSRYVNDTWTHNMPIQTSGAPYFNPVAGTGKQNRWGDYGSAVLDPIDASRIWMMHQYASSDGEEWRVRGYGFLLCSSCPIGACPAECGDLGPCIAEQCVCDAGLQLEGPYDCPNICPNECSGNGLCIYATGECQCHDGTWGRDCANPFWLLLLLSGTGAALLLFGAAMLISVFQERRNRKPTAARELIEERVQSRHVRRDSLGRLVNPKQKKPKPRRPELTRVDSTVSNSSNGSRAAPIVLKKKKKNENNPLPCPLCGKKVPISKMESHVKSEIAGLSGEQRRQADMKLRALAQRMDPQRGGPPSVAPSPPAATPVAVAVPAVPIDRAWNAPPPGFSTEDIMLSNAPLPGSPPAQVIAPALPGSAESSPGNSPRERKQPEPRPVSPLPLASASNKEQSVEALAAKTAAVLGTAKETAETPRTAVARRLSDAALRDGAAAAATEADATAADPANAAASAAASAVEPAALPRVLKQPPRAESRSPSRRKSRDGKRRSSSMGKKKSRSGSRSGSKSKVSGERRLTVSKDKPRSGSLGRAEVVARPLPMPPSASEPSDEAKRTTSPSQQSGSRRKSVSFDKLKGASSEARPARKASGSQRDARNLTSAFYETGTEVGVDPAAVIKEHKAHQKDTTRRGSMHMTPRSGSKHQRRQERKQADFSFLDTLESDSD